MFIDRAPQSETHPRFFFRQTHYPLLKQQRIARANTSSMNTRIRRDRALQFELTKVFFACDTRKQTGGVSLPPCRRLYFRPSRYCSALPALHLDRPKFFAAMGRAENWSSFQSRPTSGGPLKQQAECHTYPKKGIRHTLFSVCARSCRRPKHGRTMAMKTHELARRWLHLRNFPEMTYGKFSRCALLSAAGTQTNNNDER